MATLHCQRLREAIYQVVKGQRFLEAVGPSRPSEAAASLRAAHVGRVLEEEVLKHFDGQPDKRELGPQLGRLLDSGQFSDVVMRVGQEEISAHSAILAARSPVFEAMWSSGMREQQQKEVVMRDLDPLAIRRMLRFMYTGTLDPKLERDNEVIALLEAAHQYDIASLVDLCVSTLSSWLTEENAAEYLMIAEHAGLEGFRRRCLDFITNSHSRVAEVQTTEAFTRLAEKRPHLAIEILAKAIPPAKRIRPSEAPPLVLHTSSSSAASSGGCAGSASAAGGAASSSAAAAANATGVTGVWLPAPPTMPASAAGVATPTWSGFAPHPPPAWRPLPTLGPRPPPVPVAIAWPFSSASRLPPPSGISSAAATGGSPFLSPPTLY